MKQLIARHQHLISEFIKFALVGLLNTGVDVAIFFLLTWTGIPYVAAQVVSYSCGAADSYLINKVWTFRACGLSYSEVVRFVVVNLVSLGISLFFLALLHDSIGLGLAATKGIATVCTLLANFLGNKLWVFSKQEAICRGNGG
jgi:putative flippase GtrA